MTVGRWPQLLRRSPLLGPTAAALHLASPSLLYSRQSLLFLVVNIVNYAAVNIQHLAAVYILSNHQKLVFDGALILYLKHHLLLSTSIVEVNVIDPLQAKLIRDFLLFA